MSVPVWQPDSQASSCCLCTNVFSLFNRRHHCRKCGRIVCGDCSNQQIRYFANTIIVGPGSKQTRPSPYDTYRTCDECVEEIRMIRRALFDGVNIDQAVESLPRISGAPSSGVFGGVVENSLAETNSISSATKYLSTRTQTRMVHSSTQSSVNTTPKISAAAVDALPQGISDDDQSDHNLCPVCATNLLVLFKGTGNDEFENFKEEHINDCLTQFDFNFDHQRSPTADGSRLHTRNKMLVYNIPPIPKPQFETLPASSSSLSRNAAGGVEAEPEFTVGSENSAHSNMQMSEKYVARECVICLEDLKPGDKVGRLECLCVFHYKCIKDWFNKKGSGECPVHFLHK